MATKKTYYVEPRDEGYAVVAENAERASVLTRTQAQAQAIAEAKRLNPDKKPHVARVETTSKGKPDKFRWPHSLCVGTQGGLLAMSWRPFVFPGGFRSCQRRRASQVASKTIGASPRLQGLTPCHTISGRTEIHVNY
jgi:hypothetical protein